MRKLLFLAPLVLLASGCPGSAVHKVTVAQHDFQFTVQAFQDAEIAEHDLGFVPNDLHLQIQTTIQKVAQAGADLDTALAAGASKPTIKVKLDAIYALLDSSLKDGVLGVKNQATKAKLELALEALKAIVANAEVFVQ